MTVLMGDIVAVAQATEPPGFDCDTRLQPATPSVEPNAEKPPLMSPTEIGLTPTVSAQESINEPQNFNLQPGRPFRLFWLGLFLPVNTLFHAIAHGLLHLEPSLDVAAWMIVSVKAGYFVLVTYAIVLIHRVWQASVEPPNHYRWHYLVAGLASLAGLLLIHGERAYRYGLVEREVGREVRKLNSGATSKLPAGVKFNGVTVKGRSISIEYGLAGASFAGADANKLKLAGRPAVVAAACADIASRSILAAGIGITIQFRDRDGLVVAFDPLRMEDCAIKK
jgi:hypothetical protein